MTAGFLLCRIVIGSFSNRLRNNFQGCLTRRNLLRIIAKNRRCFYFLCNLQRDFSLRDHLQTWGVTRGSLPCNLQCNVRHCVASCNENVLVWHGLYSLPKARTKYGIHNIIFQVAKIWNSLNENIKLLTVSQIKEKLQIDIIEKHQWF